jgi:hypothetical protein
MQEDGFPVIRLKERIVVFCKRKVDQFTNENCTIFKTEQNDITNEKCATLQVKSAPGLLFLQSSSVSSS